MSVYVLATQPVVFLLPHPEWTKAREEEVEGVKDS